MVDAQKTGVRIFENGRKNWQKSNRITERWKDCDPSASFPINRDDAIVEGWTER